jgi:hypothetical protein
VVDMPHRHGGVGQGLFALPREVTFEVSFQGDSRANFLTHWRNVMYVLFTQAPKEIILDRDPSVKWTGMLNAASVPEPSANENWQDVGLEFILTDPFGTAVTAESVVNVTVDADPKAFVIDTSALEANADMDGVFTFHNTSGGNSGIVKLEDVTNGLFVQHYQSIQDGYRIRFDRANRKVETSPDGVVWTRSMWSVSGFFPPIKARSSSTWNIHGISAGSGTVHYNQRYIGG